MKIFGIGHNYKKHIEELGSAFPSSPVVFSKPETALLKKNEDFYHPSFTQNIHHEIEVVVRIERAGKNIEPEFALDYVDAVALGIDFTARDVQAELKKKGLPWDLAKGFNHSAPISKFIPVSEFEDLQNIDFNLNVNGNTRQEGNTSDMLFPIADLVSYLSKFFTLKSGDLIFTGTPHGVDSIKIGDHLIGHINGKELLNFKIK